MNSSSHLSSHPLFGVYEIDFAGTVFYHRTAEGASAMEPTSLIGQNFFETFSDFSPAGEFQYYLKRFINDSHSTDEFKTNFCCREQMLEGRVKLARLRERESEGEGSRNLIIVDIRKV